MRTPSPPCRATAAAALAAARSPASLRSAVWAKPVVSPSTTRIPAPRDRPEESSSTRRSSSRALDVTASSAKTSAMSPPPTRARGQHAFEHVRVDEGGVGHGGIVIVVPPDPSQPPTAAGHGPHAGLSAQLELTVGAEDTAEHFRSGDVPVLGHPPPHRPVRGGHLPGHRRAPQRRAVERGHPRAVRPPGARGRGLGRAGRGHPGQGRGPAPRSSRCRPPGSRATGGGLVGAGRVTRVVVDRSAFLAKAGAAGPS